MDAKKIPSLFSRVVGSKAHNAIEFDGYRWIVGEEAEFETSPEYMSGLSDLLKYAPLFIKSIKGDNVDNIAISIPTEAYYASKDTPDGGYVKRMEESIERYFPGIKELVVLPQGTSSLKYIVKSKFIDLKGVENILILDGGFNTVNYSIVTNKGKIRYSASIHNELGVYNLLVNFFREELKSSNKAYETTSNAQRLKKIFLNGYADSGLERIDVSKEKNRAVAAFIPKLLSRIVTDIEKHNIPFDQIVLVGGISYYINEEDITKSKKCFIPKENGEFFTVLGMRELTGEEFDCFDIGFGDTKYLKKKRNLSEK